MSRFFEEVAYAARGLRKSLGLATVTTITLALGIGACTAIFSVINAVLLRPLPYSDPQRLVIVWGELRARGVKDWPFSAPDYRDLCLQSTAVFEDLAGATTGGLVPIGGEAGEIEQVRAAAATPNLFRLLGARILVGRDFNETDAALQPQAQPGQPPPARLPLAAILSHALWQRRFGGDPGVVGRQIDFGGGRAEVVGVLAPDFELLFPTRTNMPRVPDVWTALRLDYDDRNRNDVLLRVVGRLKPGVTLEKAQLQVDGIAEGLRQHFAIKQTAGLHFHAVPMYEDLVGSVRPAILSLLGAVVFVQLIACANVANLLVVRASARSGELAVRAAIGASRWQLMRQILAESLVVAALGGVLGMALARAGVRLLLALGPQDLPRLEGVAVDSRVLAFAVFAGIVTAFGCGIVPALQAARIDPIEALRRSGGRASGLRGGRRLRNLLVITEVALSFILLVGAMLTLRSFAALSRVNPGFDPGNLLTFHLPAQFPEPGQRAAFMQQLRGRLLGIPGASAVTAASPLPLDGGIRLGRWGTEAAVSDPGTFRQANFHAVLPGYFETMRTPVLEGRAFTEAENVADPAKRLLVVDNLLAARAFPNQSAVGKRLLVRVNTPEAEWWEVLGVVAHQRHASLAVDGPEAIFFPDGYFGHGNATRWAVRGGGDPAQLATAVRAAVAEVAPRSALAELQPMQAFVDRAMAPLRFATTLIGIFAIVAVTLAGLGLYGVLHSIVRQRTAEIGLRMAFGAPRGGIFALVVGQGLELAALGIVAGLAGAAVVTRVVTSLLVGVTPTDPLTFASMTALFFVVAGVACWLPAQRASRLEPTVALREE